MTELERDDKNVSVIAPMSETDTEDVFLDGEFSEESEESEDIVTESSGKTPDWEKRCLAAEAALEDSLEFASLYAAEGGELDAASLRDSAVYRRFCELRGMGLSVKEAFSAADSAREKKPIPAAKSHLLSSPAKRQKNASRLSGEELAIARNLLGDDYSTEELMKLYRRVAK